METLSAEKWSLSLDSEGRILDQYNIRKIVFHKGIAEEIRHEVWPFLLGYYPFDSTCAERKRIDDEKRVRYESLLASWSHSSNLEQFDNFVEDAKTIEKDSKRTDRSLDFFSDENVHNILLLERVLKTFAFFRPDIGYVQGMSDILALPLMVLNNEHQAFWCFDFVMKTTQGRVFADLTLSQPLENLSKLCQYIDKPLFDHIDLIYEGEQWLFAYRLLLLNFRRELSVDGCSRLWECFWSCHATQHFPLLFTTTLLLHFRDTLFKCTDFEHLMQFSQCLRGKVPVNEILSQAIEILEQLKSDDFCPHEIKFLVSNEVSTPPPLVGFVRTRQRVTSLYSRKNDVQRHQIWRALFGDTPVQSITSPFMVSSSTIPYPEHTASTTTASLRTTPLFITSGQSDPSYLYNSPSDEDQGHLLSLQTTAPPKVGFVARERTAFHLREDIRRLRQSNNISSEISFTSDECYRDSACNAGTSHGSGNATTNSWTEFNYAPPSNSTDCESENAIDSSNKLTSGSCRSTRCPCSGTDIDLCDAGSQFDTLRSEAELSCC